jgi:organic radical activating enzyme
MLKGKNTHERHVNAAWWTAGAGYASTLPMGSRSHRRATLAGRIADARSNEDKMSYTVKELFLTLQGEGAQAGRTAVFCRFAGCNLWSGRERDRAGALCRFCDTDFVGTDGDGGGRFRDAQDLAAAIESRWGGGRARRYVVFTGGEPLLQLDDALIRAVKARGFEIAVETNGTIAAPDGIDWICVSPKAGPDRVVNTEAAVAWCLAHPRWRLSLQTHKLIGIP